MKKSLQFFRGPITLVLAKILFGTAAISVRLSGVNYTILLVGLHVAAALFFFLPAKKELRSLNKKNFLAVVILGIAFITTDLTYYAAVTQVDVSLATLVRWVAPVLAVLFAVQFGEVISRRGKIGIGLSFLGLVIILIQRGLFQASADWAGVALSALSAIAVAIYWTGSKILLRSVGASVVLFFRSVISLCVVVPIAVVVNASAGFSLNITAMGWLIGFALVYGIVAGYLDTKGIQDTSQQQVLVIGYLVPLTTIALSVLFLHETVSLPLWAGGLLILVGSYIARVQVAAKK